MLVDYYQVLGLSRSASQIEIKAAFRKLAKELHPDKHGGDPSTEALFKEVNEAYEILSNIEKKMAYDKRVYLETIQVARSYSPPASTTYTSPNPAGYAPRRRAYAATQLVYSKWTIMYGKIFVVLLIMFVTLFPILLEYSFSLYYYNLGMKDLESGQLDDALDNFGHAMRDLGARSTEAAIKSAEIVMARNSNFEVVSYTRLGLSYAVKRAHKAQLYYMQGIARRNLHRLAGAEESLIAALNLHYNSDSIYNELAPLYAYQLHKYSKAIATYDSLMRFHPDETENFLHRGFCYQKLGRHQAAIDDFNYYLTNSGPNGSAYYLKGVSQISLEQIDSACYNFNQALQNGVPNAAAFLLLNCKIEKKKETS
jgi:curved DNA-binding protein CbpA